MLVNKRVSYSHGRGRWFEISVAHFGAAGLCARMVGLQFGPVAQLGERCLRMAEATSSSLVGSTFLPLESGSVLVVVQAAEGFIC